MIKVGFALMGAAMLWFVGVFTVAVWTDFALSVRWAAPVLPLMAVGAVLAAVGAARKWR